MTDAPAARLRAAGLRATRQRVAVLDALASAGGHRTADDVAVLLREGGTPLPRASLYHALGTMAAAGVVLVADAGPGVTRYELASAWHHHLVCRACEAIVDVPCLSGTRPCLDASLPGARIDEAQVVFRGLCPACAADAPAPGGGGGGAAIAG